MDGYFLCLDAWSDFLDHLMMTHHQVQLGSTPPSSTSQSRCMHGMDHCVCMRGVVCVTCTLLQVQGASAQPDGWFAEESFDEFQLDRAE